MYTIILAGASLLLLQQEASPPLSFPERPPHGTYVIDDAGLLAGRVETIGAINELADDQVHRAE